MEPRPWYSLKALWIILLWLRIIVWDIIHTKKKKRERESPIRPHRAHSFTEPYSLQCAVFFFPQQVTLIDLHNQPGRVLFLTHFIDEAQRRYLVAQCHTAGKQQGRHRNQVFCFFFFLSFCTFLIFNVKLKEKFQK